MKLEEAKTIESQEKIRQLYERAFPKAEKKPFSAIVKKQQQGKVEMLMIMEEEQFCGLAITMKDKELVLLDYFAMEDSIRGSGYGSKALKLLLGRYEGKRFFLEIEDTKEKCDNLQQRQKRKVFYLNNGMKELQLKSQVFGVKYELLGSGGRVDFGDYQQIYHNIYGEKAAKQIYRREA